MVALAQTDSGTLARLLYLPQRHVIRRAGVCRHTRAYQSGDRECSGIRQCESNAVHSGRNAWVECVPRHLLREITSNSARADPLAVPALIHTIRLQKHGRGFRICRSFPVPLGAVVLSAGRRRWTAFLGMLLMVAAFSVQIACGGGSSTNNNNNPPPSNLSIGWSAGRDMT